MHVSVKRSATILALAGLALAGAACYFIPALRDNLLQVVDLLTRPDAQGAIRAFRDYLLGFGLWAPVVSAALMVFQSVAAPLPAFVVTFANGLLFGWAWGALLSWSSAMLGALLCFGIARSLGRPVVEKLVGGAPALDTADRFFARYGQRTILVTRLLPFVSFDLISYAAGLTSMSIGHFLWATGLGQLPATLLYSYLGEHVSGSVKALFWVFSISIALAVVAGSLGPAFVRRRRRRQAGAASEAASQAASEVAP